MLSIMELLCFEESLDLIGYGVVWVVPEIRRDFICRRKHRRARPARDVKNFLVRSLLGHLNRVNGAHWSHRYQFYPWSHFGRLFRATDLYAQVLLSLPFL